MRQMADEEMQLASTRLATQLSQANSEYERELVAKERGSLNQHHAWLRMQNDEAQALNVKVQEAVSMAAKERDEVEALREATGENSPSVHLLTANVISPSLHRSRHSARRRRRRRRSLKLWCKR